MPDAGNTHDPKEQWCAEGQPGFDGSLATDKGIGSGASNTQLIIENCGTDSAAGQAAAYRGGGKTDWFLPSKDELNKMYDRRTEVGDVADRGLWSSSQYIGFAAYAWVQSFPDEGKWGGFHKYYDLRVRPVRAF